LLLDGASGSTDCSVVASVDQGALSYDAVHQELFAAETAGAPGDVIGFHYDPAGPSLAQNRLLSHTILSFYLNPVAVSPDGLHLAANVEGLSDLYYSGWTDFDPRDFSKRRGNWDGGAFAFSPDSQWVIGGDYYNFNLSSVSRHMLVQNVSTAGWNGQLSSAAFSRGGAIAYALETSYGSPAVLHWMLTPASLAPTPVPSGISLASISGTADSVAALPASGSFTVAGAASDLMPLCSGLSLVENQADNSVSVVDAYGAALSVYSLPAKPMKMALDAANGWLYVACHSDGELVKLDLVSGTLALIPLSGPAYAVATGASGRGFASMDQGIPYQGISIFDGGSQAENASATTDTYSAAVLFFDASANNLFLADASVDLERMAFNPGTLSLLKTEGNWSQPSHAALAPDGLRLAATSNSAGSAYIDYNAGSFATTYGNFSVASYPGPCDFSSNGLAFLAGDEPNLKVFNSATHAVQKTIPLGMSGSDSIASARFSRGGGLAFGLVQPYGSPNSRVVWGKYP
jgi:hypothetical protein